MVNCGSRGRPEVREQPVLLSSLAVANHGDQPDEVLLNGC